MIVIGFDPGTATTGFGVVRKEGSRLSHIEHGVIATPAETPFARRLQQLHVRVRQLIEIHRPDAVAIEKLFFARNVTSGISVAQARGVIALAAAQFDVPIGEYSPLEVKNGVVGYGKATKQQVQDMVKILLNLDKRPRPDDAADGLALAIVLLYAARLPAQD